MDVPYDEGPEVESIKKRTLFQFINEVATYTEINMNIPSGKFYCVFNPESTKPVTRLFEDRDMAFEAADDMAAKHNARFFVMGVEGFSEPIKNVTRKDFSQTMIEVSSEPKMV